MNAHAVMDHCRQAGIRLAVSGDRITYRAPHGTVIPIAEILTNKPAIVALLAPAGVIGVIPQSRFKTALPEADYRRITVADLPVLATAITGAAGPIAIDCETTGLDPCHAALCGLSLCWVPGHAVYIPILGAGPCVPLPEVHAALSTPLRTAPVIGHHLMFDLDFLTRAGFIFTNIVADTLALARMLDPDCTRRHRLDDLSLAMLHVKKIQTKQLIGKGATAKTFTDVPVDDATVYGCEDADATLRIYPALLTHAEKRGLLDVLKQEMGLLQVVVRMQQRGIGVNRKALRSLRSGYIAEAAGAQTVVDAVAGRRVNIGSNTQVAVLLYDELGLPATTLTKTGRPSVDAKALGAMDGTVPAAILSYRTARKMLGTFPWRTHPCPLPPLWYGHRQILVFCPRHAKYPITRPRRQGHASLLRGAAGQTVCMLRLLANRVEVPGTHDPMPRNACCISGRQEFPFVHRRGHV